MLLIKNSYEWWFLVNFLLPPQELFYYIINDNLAQMLRLLYEQWFYRFEFPNEQNLPYNRANGELEWNDKLKRRIPKGWKVQTMLSNELFSVISSGKVFFLPPVELGVYFR